MGLGFQSHLKIDLLLLPSASHVLALRTYGRQSTMPMYMPTPCAGMLGAALVGCGTPICIICIQRLMHWHIRVLLTSDVQRMHCCVGGLVAAALVSIAVFSCVQLVISRLASHSQLLSRYWRNWWQHD
jgi:hypothetical protein